MNSSKLVKNQSKTYTKEIEYDGKPCDLVVKVRFDDECGNGHNSLSVTGSVYKRGRRSDSAFLTGGCIHDIISEHFPELREAIKYHLVSSDSPMHYVANSLYHASDRDCWGYRKGEPKNFKTRVFFNDVPVPMKDYGEKFVEFTKTVDANTLQVVECPYMGKDYSFSPKYTFNDFHTWRKDERACTWYGAPFSDEIEAYQILEALRTCRISYKTEASAYGEGKTPDLEAARACALWEDATLEDFTKEKLEARLPMILANLKRIVETLGMEY